MLQMYRTCVTNRHQWICALIIVLIYLFTALSIPIQQIESGPWNQNSIIINNGIELSDMVHVRTQAPAGIKQFLKLFMFLTTYTLLESTLWMIPYRYIYTSITSSMKRILLMPIKQTTSTYALLF